MSTPTLHQPVTVSDRERLILRRIADGLTNHAIAREVGLRPGPLANIRTELFRRIGAANAAHAVDIAHRQGLFPDTTTEDQP